MANPDVEFWNLVGERVDPNIFRVGDIVRIESPGHKRVVAIAAIKTRDDGKRTLMFRKLSAIEVILADVKATIVVNSDPAFTPVDDDA